MIEQRRFEFVLEAQQPIAHHEGSFGNTAVIMRQKVRQRNGAFVHVPIVTGDTMRHGIREASTYALLECAGLKGEMLTESALRLLFAGGMVTGAGSSVNLEAYREMVDLVPTLAMFGGCAQNRVIPGRMQVDPALLVCSETINHMPGWVPEFLDGWQGHRDLTSCRAHVEEVQRVRMDPTLDPGKQALLTEGAKRAVQLRLTSSEKATEDEDAKGKDEAKSTMMPRRFERVVQGSLWYWSVTATCYTPLDVDSLLVMVGVFLRHAVVGGKKGTGHGLLKAVAARNVQMASFEQKVETLALDGNRAGELFRAHVEERRDKIDAFLRSVAA